MSGNFDYPPANTGHTPPTLDEATSILDQARSHRSALRHRLDEVRRLRDHMSDSDERRRLRMQQSAVREEIRRRHAAEQTEPSGTFQNENDNLSPPTSALRSRIENVRNRARLRPQGHNIPTGTAESIQQAVDGLNAASSNLSTILDQPIPRIGSPVMNIREYAGEADVNRRRKRRKLDSDVSTGHMNGFSYGYRGQVVSGPLKMEFVSCDGGIHNEAAKHGKDYWPDNVLRNDKSVYCTNDSKCNIILRHLGETPFCLKKLVIKAPERGFTAPIQDGMIFVSMTSHDILSRTSQYQMRDSSPLRSNDDTKLPSSYDMPEENRPLSRRRDSGVNRTVPPPISNSIPRNIRYNGDTTSIATNDHPFPLVDIGDDSTPPPRTSQPPENLGFNVSTTCDEPSSDEEEPSSPATLADLYRRDRLPPPYDSSAEDDDDDGLDRAMRRAGRIGAPSSHNRSRRKAEPSRIEVAWPTSDAAKDEDVLAPHAKFFIERERSVVSIKFDPPVSGKFILMKLWSPAKDQNIDIQSIVCHGFTGPRFFPAAQMM